MIYSILIVLVIMNTMVITALKSTSRIAISSNHHHNHYNHHFHHYQSIVRAYSSTNRIYDSNSRSRNNNNNKLSSSSSDIIYTGTPLKCMVFIDGTWLYYSLIAGRTECPVKEKFGATWFNNHIVDWSLLPALISKSLSKNLNNRPIDVTRCILFTSVREDTLNETKRAKMITEIKQCPSIDAIVLKTVGLQEKCVDISLAVEMLYYAMIPDSYDIGVLLTGDKDFLPVMKRTRQAGKRVALCTMKNSCNNEMLNPDQLAFDHLIWLESFLNDKFIIPKGTDDEKSVSRTEELVTLIEDALRSSENGILSSRNLGRKLSNTFMDGIRALTLLKKHYRSLKKFLELNMHKFYMYFDDNDTKNFVITSKPESDDNIDELNEVLKQYLRSVIDENNFYDTDNEDDDSLDDSDSYRNSDNDSSGIDSSSSSSSNSNTYNEEYLQGLLKLELVDICQKNELPIRGTKAELVERILSNQPKILPSTSSSSKSSASQSSSISSYSNIIAKKKIAPSEKWLLTVLVDILSSSPSFSNSSRLVGRHLLTQRYPVDTTKTASDILKATHGNLIQCIKTHEDLFRKEFDDSGDSSSKSYAIALIKSKH